MRIFKNLTRLIGLTLLAAFYSDVHSQSFEGKWSGVLKFQGQEIPLIFNIQKDADSYKATMDSPRQNAKNISVNVTRADSIIVLKSLGGIEYEARWKDEDLLEGTFRQSGVAIPMELKRSKATALIKRQEPQLPLPYKSEDLKIQSHAGGIIGGTLTIPAGNDQYPLVIMISGSGPQNRNSEVFGHKPFLIIADHLSRKGYAVFRYDDRGVGESSGDPAMATSNDFATDVADIVTYFGTKKGIDKNRIGLLGHSEGGIIAPLAYQLTKNISFIILLAAPGVTGYDLLLQQQYDIGKASGANEQQLEESRKINTHVYDLILQTNELDKLQAELRSYLTAELKRSNPIMTDSQLDSFITSQLTMVKAPWFRFFITHDPQPALQKLKCPVLSLNGDKDMQVAADQNQQAIAKALAKGGNKKLTVKKLANLNHLFQECETGNISEYGVIEQTISPVVLAEITDWLGTLK